MLGILNTAELSKIYNILHNIEIIIERETVGESERKGSRLRKSFENALGSFEYKFLVNT